MPSLFDQNQRNAKDQNNINHYSCSLFIEKSIENKIQLPYYKNTFKFLAVGNTSSDRGISPLPNNRGHIDYFLYDYQKNNPYVDFKIEKEIKK